MSVDPETMEDPDDCYPRRRMAFRMASEVQPKKPMWLWRGWLVAGALHLLVGRQGQGKSTLVAWLLAYLSTAQPLPGHNEKAEPLRCAVLSLEESEDTQVARLQAIGANKNRIAILTDVEDIDSEGRPFHRAWRLPDDCSLLESFLVEEGVQVVVIDGLGYTVKGDSHNYGVVGSALSALAGVAQRTGCAVIGVTHPPKGGSDPATVAIGSTAWTAVARVVWLLAADPADETGNRKVVRVTKSNYKEPESGLSFLIGEDDKLEVGFVTDLDRSMVSKEALAAASIPADERGELDEAREVVRAILNDGPKPHARFTELTEAAGLSDRTVRRARSDLGVVSRQVRDGKRIISWELSLPDASTPTGPPTTPSPSDGPLGPLALTRGDTDTPRSKAAKTANWAKDVRGRIEKQAETLGLDEAELLRVADVILDPATPTTSLADLDDSDLMSVEEHLAEEAPIVAPRLTLVS
jgi:putative DNA primase/helicase